MAFSDNYRRQVELLLHALPQISQEHDFALKGGTAINLFARNLPRLSVDIDLTFLPIRARAESIALINSGMARIAHRLRHALSGARVHEHMTGDGILTRLIVRRHDTQVKIEINPVIRGCIHAPVMMSVSENVEKAFGFAEMTVVSHEDLYAGKLMAALDRQHPRDLFDVRELLANEGLSDALRRAFIVYLISHHRPMSEVLIARPKDIHEEYERGLLGMTQEDVPLADLLRTRQIMVDAIVGDMPADHRLFLIGFETGKPDWDLLGLTSAPDLPAVKWRQMNLDTLPMDKRNALVAALRAVLSRRGS
jgi:predicted nucleotidyltransferase component of viral defense system